MIFTRLAGQEKYLLILLLFASLSCKSGYSSMNKPEKTVDNKVSAFTVKLITVKAETTPKTIPVTGTLAAFDQAIVGVKVPGRLQQITVDLGTVVKKGQLIGEIDPQDYQLRVRQAESALAQARARLALNPNSTEEPTDPKQISLVRQAQALVDEAKIKLDRSAALVKQGIIAQAEYDVAETAHKVAISRYEDAVEEFHNRLAILTQRRSELEIARQQLADTKIFAPFDGVVQEKRASLGEFLASGAPIATVVQVNPLRLRAEIPEREANQIEIGQKILLSVEANSNTYNGQIKRLSPTLTQENRMLMVEAEILNDGSLKPGLFARAQVIIDNKNTIAAVPKSAVISFAGIEKVITVKNGKALEKTITTGQRMDDMIEVVEGLEVGEEIVAEPGNLQSGQPVNLTK
jgi:RND family efflux transporter MFP subunit